MASTSTEIANIALSLIGKGEISDISGTDTTSQACDLIYTHIRDWLIEKYEWDFAKDRMTYYENTDSLVGKTLESDNFDDASISATLWTETDEGTNVTEQNNRLEITGTGTGWNVNGVISKAAYALNKYTTWKFRFRVRQAFCEAIIGPSANSTMTYNHTHQCCLYLDSSGNIQVSVNGSNTDTGYNYQADTSYWCWIIYDGSGWDVYIQSDEDYFKTNNFDDETRVHDGSTDSTGPMYFQAQNGSAAATVYIDNYEVGYPFEPPFEYDYAYPVPDNYLKVLEMQGTTANYTIEQGFIFTNQDEFDLRYLKKETDVTKFPANFVECLTLKMAEKLAVRLKGSLALTQDLERRFKMALWESARQGFLEINPTKRARQTALTSWQAEGR